MYLKGEASASFFIGGGFEAEISDDRLVIKYKGQAGGGSLGGSLGLTGGVKLTNDFDSKMRNAASLGATIGEILIAESGIKTDGKYLELSYGGGVGIAGEVTLIPINANLGVDGTILDIDLPFNLGQQSGLLPKYNGTPTYGEWINMLNGDGW